jgi:phosphofructokinase-like protein
MAPRRIGILTGGGDCPGLNAVIRAVVKDAAATGIEVMGICDGFLGLIEGRVRALGPGDVRGILTHGGTILGASNKADPKRHATGRDASGRVVYEDVFPRCLATLERHGVEALVVVGGDGSMTAAQPFVAAGLNCIGIPKTIDNDLWGTELSFGFTTASSTAAEALDRVHTTAASHHRVIVVEVMGRNAGWIALHSGVASGSDVILMPEIPFSFESVAESVRERRLRGLTYSLICAAEGAAPLGGRQSVAKVDASSPDPVRLGGIAQVVADRLEADTGIESRYVVLGHVQRGGTPVPADRVLGTRFGHAAMELVRRGARNRMVAVQGGTLVDVDIGVPAGRQRLVPMDEPLLSAARAVGTRFGEG